jgi:hypothetical protein
MHVSCIRDFPVYWDFFYSHSHTIDDNPFKSSNQISIKNLYIIIWSFSFNRVDLITHKLMESIIIFRYRVSERVKERERKEMPPYLFKSYWALARSFVSW